jgi:amphi-Trp domain-containing protein
MELEHSTEERLRREVAADRLRAIADELSRQNEVSFEREGRRFTVKVPDEVNFKFEVEIGDDESEIEIELTW